MLTLLRKIRRSLLDGRQFQRYALYAIGEIALVVIGILIALQINNWNQNRQQKARVNVYLQNLKSDLQKDMEAMNNIKQVNLFRYHSIQYLFKQANLPPSDPAADGIEEQSWDSDNFIWRDNIPGEYNDRFVHLAFLWIHRIRFSKVSTTAIDELKSTGLFSQVQNTELKNHITAYYHQADFRITSSFRSSEKVIDSFLNSLMEEGIINSHTNLVPDPIDLIIKNKRRQGLLRTLAGGAAWYVEGSDMIKAEAEGLVEKIDEELKK